MESAADSLEDEQTQSLLAMTPPRKPPARLEPIAKDQATEAAVRLLRQWLDKLPERGGHGSLELCVKLYQNRLTVTHTYTGIPQSFPQAQR